MKRIIVALAVVSVLFSCTREYAGSVAEDAGWKDKIINTKSGAELSSLLVKTEDPLSLSEIPGVTSVNPLFVSVPGKDELEKRFGLDRWYELVVDADCDIESVANSAAQSVFVNVVEYNAIVTSDIPAAEPCLGGAAQTKAAGSQSLFNDTYCDLQWNYYNTGDKSICEECKAGADINVRDVWSTLTCGDPDIVVAVLDEGIKYTHPDLAANMWVNTKEIPGNGIDDDKNGYVDDYYGYNCTATGPSVIWVNGSHGTHCAGTIAAVNNNGLGVCGVAGGSGKGDGCRIMSVQCLNKGGGTIRDVAKAAKYAADNGASVISCSIGSTVKFETDNAFYKAMSVEVDAVRYFEATNNNPYVSGGVAVFSSGNESSPFSNYPGATADFVSVSAIGPDYLPTYYTNYGPGCNIAAPGGEAGLPPFTSYKAMVLSTSCSECDDAYMGVEGGYKSGLDYCYFQGTSMACPHVAGVVALGISYAKKIGKKMTLGEFKQLLVSSTSDIDKRILAKPEKKLVSGDVVDLGHHYHNMGTGAIDAWQFMMNIEGVPCLSANVGEKQWLSLESFFGTSASSLTYLGVEIDQAGSDAIGLAEAPYIKYGKLWVHPTKAGSAKLTVKVVGGGDHLGGGDNPAGGMELTRVVSVIARESVSQNGGWL